ncbi:DNA-directed RNA polymerase I subunit RPA43 [Amphibalanus amphitrite]|uniref:DNA-directed RNA polymerase I subunit RPA43 n=1 Tax=Amphibalanus amphitrite TaxID=1232801 RepID=A0A6A4WA53_AMPAM|nr:DNA-directed RNA polymerase I subunit RPA43 [Amphibalanus amphitrite]
MEKLESEDDFQWCLRRLEAHFAPKQNVCVERYRFRSRGQQPGETTSQWVSVLRQLASTCEYGAQMDGRAWTGSYGPERKWYEFKRIFLAALDRIAPLRRSRLRTNRGPPTSAGTARLLKQRRAALDGGDRDLYREINRQCRAAVRKDSREYYQREIDKAPLLLTCTELLSRPVGPTTGRTGPHLDKEGVTSHRHHQSPITSSPHLTQLNGIMVGYENLAMLGSKGHMIPGYHHIHINIRADFYVFKPVIGGTLTGTVLKKSSSSVTCLTNKVFTVFVVLPAHMKRSLHKIQIHDEISFTIEKIDLLSQIPLSSGSSSHVRFDSESAEPDSGLSSIEDGSLGRSPAESAETPHSRKHKKRRRDRGEAEGEEPPVAEPAPAEEEPARRKSKKRRREDDDQVNGEEASPRKAKKRHRSEPEPEPVVEELYLADPVPPTSSQKKKKKRREQADLNGSISGMLR